MGDMSIGYATRRGTHYSIGAAFRNISASSGFLATLKREYCPTEVVAIAICCHTGSNIINAGGILYANGDISFVCPETAVSAFVSIEYDVPES